MRFLGFKINKVTLIKITFYFISLWLLFILIVLMRLEVPCFSDIRSNKFDLLAWLKLNWLAVTAFCLALLALLSVCIINKRWIGFSNLTHEIESIKEENYLYLTFLTAYIIPLIGLDLTQVRYVIVLAVLIIVIGYIFIKMDLYCGNPTLALMGYRLYRAKIKSPNVTGDVILITRDRLQAKSSIIWIPLSKNIWVVKEIK